MNICVYQIRAVADGAEAEIFLEVTNGTSSQDIKGRVSAAMLAELGLPASVKQPIPLSRERCDDILRMMKLYAAIRKGIDLLGYAKNTAKTLKNKLKMKGYPPDIAEDAVSFLIQKGFIREKDDAALFARTLAERKYYGRNRIRQELFSKGFDADVIRETLSELDIDFAEICAARLGKMGGTALFEDADTKRKTVAALMRYGFAYEDIRGAQEILKER